MPAITPDSFFTLSPGIRSIPDPLGTGAFIAFGAEKAAAHLTLPVGKIKSLKRFTACHRYEPFWMKPAAGTNIAEIPSETQSLLIELTDHSTLLIVPLIDGAFRCALQGNADGTLELVAESGDIGIVTQSVIGLFVAHGTDPYTLLEKSAVSVAAHLKMGRLRKDKPLPKFVDQFGWCTWDAFYQEVTHEKVRIGLQSFKDGGVMPRMLILDDGWQSEKTCASGERRLTGFTANTKFPGDLSVTTAMAKQEFGIDTFLVWHAFNGYWGGIDQDSFPQYHIHSIPRLLSPGIQRHTKEIPWWGTVVGVIDSKDVYQFYHEYHRHLRNQGVDGVKVDNQAYIEMVAQGMGGRVEIMRRYHEALEGSVHTHFTGELINCMSCDNTMLYSALNSTITRTSTDFWPTKPESHGAHLYANAQVTMWWGHFVHPDWDMFQSAHEMGPYHAAGRAVGGVPVYVSDKPEAHNFDILRKMVLPNGSVLRAAGLGMPTRDCLFHDVTKEDVLLKIFNHNAGSAIVGVFHARYSPDGPVPPISGTLSPSDVPHIAGSDFIIYAHNAKSFTRLKKTESLPITLNSLEYELFTIVPVEHGRVPIGLLDMFNSAGVITSKKTGASGASTITLRAGGKITIWAENVPREVTLDDHPADYAFDSKTHLITVTVPGNDPHTLRIL